MRLSPGDEKRLKLESERHSQKAAQSLVEGDVEAAERHIRWVRAASELLDQAARHRRPRLALGVGALSLFLLFLGSMIPVPRILVRADLLVDDLSFRTGLTPIQWRAVDASALTVTGGSAVQVGSPWAPPSRPSILRMAGRARLVSVTIPAGNLVDVDRTGATSSLHVHGDMTKAELALDQGTVDTGDVTLQRVRPGQGPLDVFVQGPLSDSAASPLTLSFDRAVWRELSGSTKSVDFRTENPPGSGKFQSSLLSGSVRVLETGETLDLQLGDTLTLTLEHPTTTFSVSDSSGHFHVRLQGTAGDLRAGPPQHVMNRMPTVMKYLYASRRTAFLWTALVFVWSLLWSARALLASS